MSMEFIVIISTVLSAGIALAGLILNGQRTQREQISGLREEVGGLRKEINDLRERMARLEGLMEGLREAITGRRVAEDHGEYGGN